MGRSVRVATLDTIFSKCIRERNDWVCEYDDCKYCENISFRNYPGGLHNSHFRGRAGRVTRWDPDNCFALCNKRHEYLGNRPDEHSAWVCRELGDTRFDALVLKANGHRKYTPADRWEMNKHYNNELNRLLNERMNGVTGYITLVSFD